MLHLLTQPGGGGAPLLRSGAPQRLACHLIWRMRAALQAGEPLHVAAQWGCVAASFLAECQAVPDHRLAELRPDAEERLHKLRPLLRRLAVHR